MCKTLLVLSSASTLAFAEPIVFVCQSVLQVTVKSIHDPKVGVIFDARSLIQALTILISEHMDMCVSEVQNVVM